MVDFNSLNYYQKWTYIVQNIQFAICIIGIISSTFTFVIFLRKRFRKISFCFYARIMALSDGFCLIYSIRHWAALILDQDLDFVSVGLCKLGEYSVFSFSSVSVWLLALIGFDRCLTIIYPNRFPFIRKLYFKSLMVGFVIVASFSMYLAMPIYYSYNSELGNLKYIKNVLLYIKGR